MNKENRYLKLRHELDELVRGGRIAEVRSRLLRLNHKEIARPAAAGFANIARRVQLPHLSLRILNPIVRPETLGKEPATENEIAEYAVALQRIGSVREALKILESILSPRDPIVHYYKVFCYFPRWEYRESIPVLRRYVESEGVEDYQRIVGRVNLAAALIFEEQYAEASTLLAELRVSTKPRGFHLLHANALELSGQLAIAQNDLRSARRFLGEATLNLATAPALDSLFIEKWAAVLESLETRSDEPLLKLREKSRLNRHWETVREVDYFRLKIRSDEHDFRNLYFGTPYPAYRSRLTRTLGLEAPNESDCFEWNPTAETCQRKFDLVLGKEVEGNSELTCGQLPHRLLALLCSDFYRPIRMATVFDQLFPDEFFNPTSSPNRVHQAVNRLKNWLRLEKIPLAVANEHGAYSLVFKRPFGIWVPAQSLVGGGAKELEFRRLRKLVPEREFPARLVQERLELPYTSANRLLRWCLESSRLERKGTGTQTVYIYATEQDRSNAKKAAA